MSAKGKFKNGEQGKSLPNVWAALRAGSSARRCFWHTNLFVVCVIWYAQKSGLELNLQRVGHIWAENSNSTSSIQAWLPVGHETCAEPRRDSTWLDSKSSRMKMLAGIEASGVCGTDKHRPGYIDNADKLPGNDSDSNGFCCFYFLLFESVAKMLSAYIVLRTKNLQRV